MPKGKVIGKKRKGGIAPLKDCPTYPQTVAIAHLPAQPPAQPPPGTPPLQVVEQGPPAGFAEMLAAFTHAQQAQQHQAGSRKKRGGAAALPQIAMPVGGIPAPLPGRPNHQNLAINTYVAAQLVEQSAIEQMMDVNYLNRHR